MSSPGSCRTSDIYRSSEVNIPFCDGPLPQQMCPGTSCQLVHGLVPGHVALLRFRCLKLSFCRSFGGLGRIGILNDSFLVPVADFCTLTCL